MLIRPPIVRRAPWIANAGLSVLLVLIASATWVRAQGQSADVIRACTRQVGARKEITMMVIADSCEPGWTLLEWNVQGPPGPMGPQGVPGEKGDQGQPGGSPWQMSGTSTFYSGGNVGIGTSNPAFPLSLGSTLGNTKLALYDKGASNSYGLGVVSGAFRFHLNNSQARFAFFENDESDAKEVFTVTGTGNVHASGKGTFAGGIDPPYISFSNESHESIRAYAQSVETHEKVMQFWNGQAHRMEIYVIEEDQFYTMTGELIPEGN